MGIKGFSQFLDHINCNWTSVDLSKFSGKTMAIDATMYLYQLKLSTKAPERTLVEFIVKLKGLNIRPIFVLDGQYLIEKEEEQTARALRRKSLQTAINLLSDQLQKYKDTKIIGPELGKLAHSQSRFVSKLGLGRLNVYAIETHIARLVRDVQPIPKTTKELFYDVCDAFNIMVITAPNDGEMLCATLNRTGLVDLVFSHDSDVFPMGAVHVVKQINGPVAKYLSLDNILMKSLLSFDAFKDFCILCGTDFNKKIPGLGPITAYNLLKKWGSLENIANNTVYSLETINYKRVREIFSDSTTTLLETYEAPTKQKIFHNIIMTYKLYYLWPDIRRLWNFI